MVLRKSWWNDFQQKKQRMRLDVFLFWTKASSLTCVWWVSLTERLQTGAVSLQKPTIMTGSRSWQTHIWLAKHRFNHKAAVILACVESVSNRVIARKRAKKKSRLVPSWAMTLQNYKAKVSTPPLAAWTWPACFLNNKANFEDYKSKEISKSRQKRTCT